jgi:hypothetical protein
MLDPEKGHPETLSHPRSGNGNDGSGLGRATSQEEVIMAGRGLEQSMRRYRLRRQFHTEHTDPVAGIPGKEQIVKLLSSIISLALIAAGLTACSSPSIPQTEAIPTLIPEEVLTFPSGETALQRLETIIRLANNEQSNASLEFLQKIDSHLQVLVAAFLSGDNLEQVAETEGLQLIGRERVLVELRLVDFKQEYVQQLERIGLHVDAVNEDFRTVSGDLPIESILAASREDFVQAITPVTAFGTD